VQAGAFAAARTLLAVARKGPVDELQRARIDLLHAHLTMASSRANVAPGLFLAAARRLEPLDLVLSRETYLDAFHAAQAVARFNEGIGVREIAQAARAAPSRSDSERTAADLLLDGLVALTDDYRTGVPLCREAFQKLASDSISPKERFRWWWVGCTVALELWDDESAYLLSHHGIRIARETGTLNQLVLALRTSTPVLVFCGELSAAASTVAEAHSVEEATRISALPFGALILAAWRGQAREARELIEIMIREAGSRGLGIGVAISEYTRAVLSNGAGQYDEGLIAARSASEHHEVIAENWGLTELVESAARAGRVDLATDALDRLAVKARASGSGWALGIEARSRALLSEGDTAEEMFGKSIEHLSRTRVRAELARAHLLYGEWLRREGRRVAARSELKVAHEMFNAMGAAGFAERTRRELLASGATARKRTEETRDDLTAQETQIAFLARDGLSNPEIGAQLFIGARTVEWHLGKVFTKLGISRRGQLVVALRDARRPTASV
jgi:DNA-binding CsgD family transcriptional regulator